MKKGAAACFVFCFVFFIYSDFAIAGGRFNSSEISACIRDASCNTLFLVAHRARGSGGPENSCEAARNSVNAGIPAIEIDVRLSKDGELFAIHNDTLDATTASYGKIKDFTTLELADVFLKNNETLPRFRDIYAITRGRAIIDLHFKADAMEKLAEWISENGSFNDVIFFADSKSNMKTAAKLKGKYPDMIVMARIRSKSGLKAVRRIFKNGLPEIIHISGADAKDIQKLRGSGFKVFIKSDGAETLEREKMQHAINCLVNSGAQFILVDNPVPFLEKILN